MKTLLQVTIIFLFGISSVWAGHEGHTHKDEELPETKQIQGVEGVACKDIIDVTVNGLVCDFCARALEKVLGKHDDVLGIDVDLDNGKVNIAMKEDKTIDNATLTQLIMDSGYSIVVIDKGC